MLSWKAMTIHLIAGLIKKSFCEIWNCQEQDNHSGNQKKGERDLSNYATKSDVEKVKGVDTSAFAKKSLFSWFKI